MHDNLTDTFTVFNYFNDKVKNLELFIQTHLGKINIFNKHRVQIALILLVDQEDPFLPKHVSSHVCCDLQSPKH